MEEGQGTHMTISARKLKHVGHLQADREYIALAQYTAPRLSGHSGCMDNHVSLITAGEHHLLHRAIISGQQFRKRDKVPFVFLQFKDIKLLN